MSDTLPDRFRAAHQVATRSTLWTNCVNGPIGSVICALLVGTRVSPNALTVSSFVVVSLAALPYALGQTGLAAALALFALGQLGYALDCADGALARLKELSSAYGAFLDVVFDRLGHLVLLTLIAVGALVSSGADALAVQLSLGSLVVTSCTLAFAVNFRALELAQTQSSPRESDGAARALLASLVDYGFMIFCLSIGVGLGRVVEIAATLAVINLIGLAVFMRNTRVRFEHCAQGDRGVLGAGND